MEVSKLLQGMKHSKYQMVTRGASLLVLPICHVNEGQRAADIGQEAGGHPRYGETT